MQMSRRSFCLSAIGAAATLGLTDSQGRSAGKAARVKFFKNLAPGHLGVGANPQQALQYATQYGFDSIAPDPGPFMNNSETEIQQWLGQMKDKGIRYGTAGLPVEFRRDDDQFRSGMTQLPKQARTLRQLGVTRVATWILPGHNELTYLENFELHRRRLRAAGEVLNDNGIRLGLEFVGPRTARMRSRFPFICTQAGMLELCKAIDLPNMGLLMDSWHWYTSHGTAEELMKLSNKDIVHVHVNDAPSGIDIDKQIDSRRMLPVTSGVIDMKAFVNALATIGYDGPVECEPFDQELREMDDSAALQKTIDALNRVWDLIAV